MFGIDLSERLPEERAVSPVIGVILMVAVVVVLAAVVTGFVFGIGDDLGDAQPTVDVQFDYDATNGNMTILHDGGDQLTDENVGRLEVTGPNPVAAFELGASAGSVSGADSIGSAPITAGDEIVTLDPTNSYTAGDTYELRWQSNDGSQSETLGEFTIPVDE